MGGGSEIDFICFLSSFAFQVGEDPSFLPLTPSMLHPKSTTTPTVHLLLSSPRHPSAPLPLPVFWGRNHRLPSCTVSLFFQTPAHVQLPLQHVLLSQTHTPHSPVKYDQPFFLVLKKQNNNNVVCDRFSYSLLRLRACVVTDSLRFAAGSQSAVVRHPLLEQPEPRRPAQPRPAAGT